jgi:general secretion pathway protein E
LALAEIVSPVINISSIEDPVEYHLKGINQFQANAKTGFTFAKAMRSMLRQDPDVVMIGEIRDSETAKLATEAALTGHLVLSTLHTNDAPSAIPRIVNMGTEPYLVAASLRAVLAQRLVKRLCPECREKTPISPALRNALSQKLTIAVPEHAYASRGCGRCHQSGHLGRTGVHEIMLADEEMLQNLSSDMSLQTLRKLAKDRGYRTLLDDVVEKMSRGEVGLEAVYDILGYSESAESESAARAA